MHRRTSLLQRESQFCSWGDTVHYADPPKFFSNCEGSYLYDENNTAYLDWQMWYSAVNFGYKNKRINDALKKQIDTLPQLACQYLHEEKVKLSEAICTGMETRTGEKGRVHFNVGGSQSVEDSLKLVRKVTHKNSMFAFMGGYHGRTLAVSEITSSYRYRRPFGHFSNRAHFVPFPYPFRFDGQGECGEYHLKEFKKLFDTEYYSYWDDKAKECEFGAFYMETIQGTGGYVIPPRGYFEELGKFLRERNILIVVDDIQMGMYRTGKLWSFEHFGLKPDILIFGKALTNGMNPIAGIWAKEDLINPKVFPPGSTHSTFSSNTLGTAAGLAVMDLIADSDFDHTVPETGKYFLSRLQELKQRWKCIGHVDGIGLALRIEMCQSSDSFSPNRALTDRIFQEGLKGDIKYHGKTYGLVLDVGGYYKNTFTLAPSLYITKEEIDLGIGLFEELLKRCQAN